MRQRGPATVPSLLLSEGDNTEGSPLYFIVMVLVGVPSLTLPLTLLVPYDSITPPERTDSPV